MADIIKQINLGTPYELAVKYIRDTTAADDLDPTALHTWQDILSLINAAKLPLITATTLPTASADTIGAIYLVSTGDPESGTYVEWITLDKGASANPRYVWEKIGTTAADLTDYVKKDTTYANAAVSDGAHTHTVSGSVTVPTVTASTKRLTVSRTTDVALSTNTKTVLTGLGTATTASAITGFGSHTTATFLKGVKVTTQPVVGLTTSTASATGLVNVVTGLTDGITGVSYTTSYITATATGTAAAANGTDTFVKSYPGATATVSVVSSITNGTAPTWTATVTSGVLSFSFAAGTTPQVVTSKAQTIMTGLGTATTATALTGVKISTQPTITLSWNSASTNTNVNAVKTVSGTGSTNKTTTWLGTSRTTNVAVGSDGTGAGITALGAASTDTFVKSYPGTTGTVLSGVTVSTQPAVTLSDTATSGGIVFVSSVTTGTTSASLTNGTAASNGAHTHDIKVNS